LDKDILINTSDSKIEMHILAYYYHWELETILNLTRRDRREWVELVQKQKEAEAESFKEGVDS
jgi:hypothetical protein